MTHTRVPESRRDDTRETIHGVTIADPYRWLEDGESSETRTWTEAQNAYTAELLNGVPGRRALESRLGELFLVGTVSSPALYGDHVFFLKREGEQNQPLLCVMDGIEGAERVLVDPNAADAEGLTSLDWWFPSDDGQLVAYGMSENGDEWSTLRVIEVESGQMLPDAITRTRYSSVAWLPDKSGFFYTRYPDPGSVPPGEEHYNSHVYFHQLGDNPQHDPKVFGEGRSPQDMISVSLSKDGRWLVAVAFQGWARSEVYLRDCSRADSPFVAVAEGIEAIFDNPIATADRLYLRTNWGTPNYRIVAVDPQRPALDALQDVVAERPNRIIEQFVLARSCLVTHELESATSRLRVYSRDGEAVRELELPSLGSVQGLDGEQDSSTVVLGYASFDTPSSMFAFDAETGERRPISPLPPPIGFDPDTIAIQQVHYPSRDGTRISMFLVHRRDLARDGTNPTLLTGYGGFNISMGPGYSMPLPAWLEQGGVYALPNLRGGGEYGEAWHQAGMRDHKQNVFDDFIAAAEWLIAEGYTSPSKLAIAGGSNGGLLVGAAMTQRPELFRAVYCAVPLLDMLRYHQFSIAKLWIPEFGSADEEEAFHWLSAYSPYHHVVEGTSYPATLITTGEQDSRVEPLHARKMVALLQHATGSGDDRPILLRAENRAGHGAGKPLNKRVAEAADQWGFIGWQLGVDWT